MGHTDFFLCATTCSRGRPASTSVDSMEWMEWNGLIATVFAMMPMNARMKKCRV